ncbi:MAG: nucleotidyl transferase AbiEii/AbiGii toxin family protein [bacterium]|nr:nucleotidyl transferase AbiEii/AbiGii toxin family protein [bacterium]
MIDQDEISKFVIRFGTPEAQIDRDHLISHTVAGLAALPRHLQAHIVFFGGTALCRTWLPDLRLSEDIDLIVDAANLDHDLTKQLSRTLRREFPEHDWLRLKAQHNVATWNLVAGKRTVNVQFVDRSQEWKPIPTTKTAVQLRYSDLPETVELTVPTPAGFAAMKLMAWHDRHTPRDLYDLAALARAGHIGHEATRVVKATAGFTPSSNTVERQVPRGVLTTWQAELGHQLADIMPPELCLTQVRDALDNLADPG